MAIAPFLAMTAAEMAQISTYPRKIAWMACHFSPYGLGLSNLPERLPPGSLLMVDDITPPGSHDPVLIGNQLARCAEQLQCSGILLDFQRSGCPETEALANYLTQALPCPVAVSEPYARGLGCPVFLSLLPPSVPLQEHLAFWQGREIWLELGLEAEQLELTEDECSTAFLPCPLWTGECFSDESLHCHYTIRTTETSAVFTLWRTVEDLQELLKEAEQLGVANAIGLYQELGYFPETFPPEDS